MLFDKIDEPITVFQSADEFDVPLRDKVVKKTVPAAVKSSYAHARLGGGHVRERRGPHETLRTDKDRRLDSRSETVGRTSDGQ